MNDRVYNQAGIFRFYFWIKDGWYRVNISDELPINNDDDSGLNVPFAAQKSNAGAWWMPLLEKANAKEQDYNN